MFQFTSERLAAAGGDGRPRANSGACKATGGRPWGACGGQWNRAGGRQIVLRWAAYGLGRKAVPTIFCLLGRQLAPRWAVYAKGQNAVPTICRACSFEAFLVYLLPMQNQHFVFRWRSAGELVGTMVATLVGTQKSKIVGTRNNGHH